MAPRQLGASVETIKNTWCGVGGGPPLASPPQGWPEALTKGCPAGLLARLLASLKCGMLESSQAPSGASVRRGV
jgi:hypothetical protein